MNYHYQSFHGGLGDALQHSTLPEMLSKLGHKVHLWERATFRNPGIRELITMNPFLLPPIPNSKWTLGDIEGLPYKNTQDDFIKNWEVMFGLPPTNSYPRIYYTPKDHIKYDGLIELSSISLKYDRTLVIAKAMEVMRENPLVHWKYIVGSWDSGVRDPLPGVPTLHLKDIFGLCDAIGNCKNLLTLNSGTHSLAAALQRTNPKMKHTNLIPAKDWNWIMEGKRFVYPNITYIPV